MKEFFLTKLKQIKSVNEPELNSPLLNSHSSLKNSLWARFQGNEGI